MMRSARRTLALVVGPLAVVLGLAAGVIQLGAAYKNSCARYGPAPAAAVISESGDDVSEHRTFWPIGSVCDWRRADGAGTVRSYNGDFVGSAATYAAIGGGIALTAVGSRRRSVPQPS